MKVLPIRLAFSTAGFLFNLGLERVDPDEAEEAAPVVRLPLPFGFELADPIDEFEVPDALGER